MIPTTVVQNKIVRAAVVGITISHDPRFFGAGGFVRLPLDGLTMRHDRYVGGGFPYFAYDVGPGDLLPVVATRTGY